MKKLLLLLLLVVFNLQAQRGGDHGNNWIEVVYFDHAGSSYASARSNDVGAGCYLNLASEPSHFASLHNEEGNLIIHTTGTASMSFSIVGNSFASAFSDSTNNLYRRSGSEYRGVPSNDAVVGQLNLDQNCALGGFVGANGPTEEEMGMQTGIVSGTIAQNVLAGNTIRITDFFGPDAVLREDINEFQYVGRETVSALEYNTFIRTSGGAESLYVPFPSTDEYSLITYRHTLYGISTDIIYHVQLSDNTIFRIARQDNRIDVSAPHYQYVTQSDYGSEGNFYWTITQNIQDRWINSFYHIFSRDLFYSTEEACCDRRNNPYPVMTIRPSISFGGIEWRFIRASGDSHYYYDGSNRLIVNIDSGGTIGGVEINGVGISHANGGPGFNLYIYIYENLRN